MLPLIYDKPKCQEMVNYAEAHPLYHVDFVAHSIGAKPIDFSPYRWTLPGEVAVFGFTVEEQEDGSWQRHFSIQPIIQVAAVAFILKDFGIDWDMGNNDPLLHCIPDTLHNAIDLYFSHPTYTPPAE